MEADKARGSTSSISATSSSSPAFSEAVGSAHPGEGDPCRGGRAWYQSALQRGSPRGRRRGPLQRDRGTETEEQLVFYRKHYDDCSHWARPLAMLDELVDRASYSGPRFARIVWPWSS
ncbi:MAG: DUF1653 domain-containing protein [Microbacterium sp.]|uniref:DUF1653 domain-containing protein n=1 Tax=Microbacterium sp. TaxID=51671 RepID=UPI002829A8D7|nr:DUF1653 domain-containing protein [Microbacterium sp.]MDR2321815.1 DUF1653 domain-containing protein [Microbacterium sp.]